MRRFPFMRRYDSAHRQAVLNVFPEVYYDSNEPIFEYPLLIVAFTNRCGSNMLCDMLAQSGYTGKIGERLNSDVISNSQQRNPQDSFTSYIKDVSRRVAKPGQIFGLKASYRQIFMLHEFGIYNMFPGVRVVHIYRNDVVAQAVSYSIADQTKQWTSLQESKGDDPIYKYSDIRTRMQGVLSGNQGIQEICALLELPKLDVCYEQLERKPLLNIRRVLDFLDMNARDLGTLQPSLQRQASALNLSYCKRFRNEFFEREAI